MNLADLIKRKDRSIEVKVGEAEAIIHSHMGHKMHAVKLVPGTILYIQGAHEFDVFKTFPRLPNWLVLTDIDKNDWNDKNIQMLIIEIESLNIENKSDEMFVSKCSEGEIASQVIFNWPVWSGFDDGYNLKLTNNGKADILVCTSYAFNPREKITSLIKGKGVEVGPGLNPHILPSQDIDVRYVETMSAEEWLNIYKKQDKPPKAVTENLWSKYFVGDARELTTIDDNTLDFIFCNHVFEHLMNPLQVLENWFSKLKKGGMIVGVIPDCRYTFDLRQKPSTKEEWLSEFEGEINEVGRDKYERWCEYTAPYNTPESLIERNYSIHVHYYTSQTFIELINLFEDKNEFQSFFFNTSPNNKDFGFVIQKNGVAK